MGALLAAPKIRHLVARLRGLLRVFRLALRCCGGLFATTLMALSKRAHASGCNSNSGFFAMPQPLSRVAPNAGIMLNNAGDRPLQRHPELAILAADVIASWATVESFMLTGILQMTPRPAVNTRGFPDSLQGRSAIRTATVTSGSPNSGRGADLAIFAGIWTHSSHR